MLAHPWHRDLGPTAALLTPVAAPIPIRVPLADDPLSAAVVAADKDGEGAIRLLTTGSELYFERPGASQRALCRGVVEQHTADTLRVRLADRDFRIADGAELDVYFDHNRRFSKLPIRILAHEETDGYQSLQVAITGRPIPSDQREHLRVELGNRNVSADFDDEIGCEVLDLSARGLSLVATDRHVPGAIVDLALYIEGERLRGRGAVQFVHPLPNGGGFRYGIHFLETCGSTLTQSIHRIHAALRNAHPATETIGI